jgi:signal transduction histidine kinase
MNRIIQNVLGIVLLAVILIVCFTVAFSLTPFIYQTIGQSPSAYFSQLMNLFLSLILAAVIIKIIDMFDHQTKRLFGSVIDAQKQIAGGNFQVRLDKKTDDYGPFSDLIESVNQMAVDLDKLEQMRQEFISNASHEIQSPLTSIRGFTQTLQNDQLPAEKRTHYLNIIEAESIRLSTLADNLLRLAALEADTLNLKPSTYRLDRQIRETVLTYEPQWSQKNIDMELVLEMIKINADKEMLSQVWNNLISNSIKFTPKDGRINIELYQQNHNIIFKISDTGIGMDEKVQNRIFERFYKADPSRNPLIKGNGLGLSIVKRIVDLNQGTIDVQSQLDSGTTFTINLPANNKKISPAK